MNIKREHERNVHILQPFIFYFTRACTFYVYNYSCQTYSALGVYLQTMQNIIREKNSNAFNNNRLKMFLKKLLL